jgi:hypothetical protein
VDAVKLNRQDAASVHTVKLSDDLFAIDREAREAQLDHAARHLLHQEKAPPLPDQIREHGLATSKTVLPESAAGKACSYTLALLIKLTCFLDHPQLELSNNLIENSMRGVATGRTGSILAASRPARVWRRFCRSSKAAGSSFGCATTWPVSCPALLTRPSGASPGSLPLHGRQTHSRQPVIL